MQPSDYPVCQHKLVRLGLPGAGQLFIWNAPNSNSRPVLVVVGPKQEAPTLNTPSKLLAEKDCISNAGACLEDSFFTALEQLFSEGKVIRRPLALCVINKEEDMHSCAKQAVEYLLAKFGTNSFHCALVPGGLVVPIVESGLEKVVAAVSFAEKGRLDFGIEVSVGKEQPPQKMISKIVKVLDSFQEVGDISWNNPALEMLYRTIDGSNTTGQLRNALLEFRQGGTQSSVLENLPDEDTELFSTTIKLQPGSSTQVSFFHVLFRQQQVVYLTSRLKNAQRAQ